ncbi:MAG: TIM44-like domain-containing protein [Ruminiclostridium sp.]|nr:TIM44-like domain-containing protein [Ruminiclostridium sp.]
MKKIIATAIATITAALLLCFSAGAFDNNDYGGGGDYGGGDYGGYDYGGTDYGSSSSGDSDPFLTIVGIGVVVLILAISALGGLKKKSSGGGTTRPSSPNGANVVLPDRTGQIEDIIKQGDPNFSASDFITFTKQVYIDIENAWCNRDLTPVRPVMHENLYNTTCKQVQAKIDQGVVYHYESIAIDTAYLTSYQRDSQFEYVTAYLTSRMIDYQVDEKTGNIIRGDKTTRWVQKYKMKFVRSLGVQTKTETGTMNGHNCPNCGAPLEISSSGVCEYCGSVVTTGQYTWVLTDFSGIRNDTTDDGIKGV